VRLQAVSGTRSPYDTKIVVDQHELISPTHLVDCFKGRIALEIEWNNKDPFFNRDLNNFRLLFDLRAVSVGVIITKSDKLIPVLRQLGIFSKYGMTTTWMSKLVPRIEGGGGGGCPIVAFGITPRKYIDDISDDELRRVREALDQIRQLPRNRRPAVRRIIAQSLADGVPGEQMVRQVKDAIEQVRAAPCPGASAGDIAEEDDEDGEEGVR